MAVGSVRDEPSITELIEARDRTDGGVRLAVPQLFDGLGSDGEPALDGVALERAETWITELHERVAEAELVLAIIGGFVKERSLGAAAVNSTAIKLGEAREQLPVLRQVVRDMEGGS